MKVPQPPKSRCKFSPHSWGDAPGGTQRAGEVSRRPFLVFWIRGVLKLTQQAGYFRLVAYRDRFQSRLAYIVALANILQTITAGTTLTWKDFTL